MTSCRFEVGHRCPGGDECCIRAAGRPLHEQGGTIPIPSGVVDFYPHSVVEDELERLTQYGDGDLSGLNPKDAAQLRDKKPPLDLLERAANEATAWAMGHGAEKYGRQNYLTIPIHARIYAAAVMRHAQQFLDGEDTDADSGLSHWAHIGANVHVFLAALAAGKVVDDRGPAPRTPEQDHRSDVSNQARYG